MFQVFLDTLCCGSFSSLDAVSTSQSSVSVMDALTAVSMDIFTFISSFCFSTCRRSILSLPPNALYIKAHGVLHSVDNAASQETSVNLTHCPWFFTPEKRGQRSWQGCWLEEKMEMKTPHIKLCINMDPNSYGISKLIFLSTASASVSTFVWFCLLNNTNTWLPAWDIAAARLK